MAPGTELGKLNQPQRLNQFVFIRVLNDNAVHFVLQSGFSQGLLSRTDI
jgi:hypothetical protein